MAATASHAVDERIAPALLAVRIARDLTINEVAAATRLDLKFVKEVFSGKKTASAEALDEIVDGFTRRGRGLLRDELRALEAIARAQRKAHHAALRGEGVSETRRGGGSGKRGTGRAPRAHHFERAQQM